MMVLDVSVCMWVGAWISNQSSFDVLVQWMMSPQLIGVNLAMHVSV